MKTCFSLLINLFLIFSISVQAGVVVTMNQEVEGAKIKSEQKMFIENDRLRMEMSGEEENQTIIFRGDKNVFWVIDRDKKSYFEMTQDDIVKLKAQMEKMQVMMKEQMKNMPAEQRKMMEDMMPSTVQNKKKEKVTYVKKADGVKVGKWSTTHYIGTREGKNSDEIWTADWSQVGFDKSSFAVMTKMADFFSALSQDATEFMKIGSDEWEKEMGVSGMPVRWVGYMNDGSTSEGSVKDISEKDLSSSLFEVPTGFVKDQSPWDKQGNGTNPYMQE